MERTASSGHAGGCLLAGRSAGKPEPGNAAPVLEKGLVGREP